MVEFTGEIIWAWTFIYQKFLSKNLIPLTVIGLFRASILSWVFLVACVFQGFCLSHTTCWVYMCRFGCPFLSFWCLQDLVLKTNTHTFEWVILTFLLFFLSALPEALEFIHLYKEPAFEFLQLFLFPVWLILLSFFFLVAILLFF